MSIAASLLVLAAASAPQPARAAPPLAAGSAQAAQPQPGAPAGVHATAGATAVILRAAVVSFAKAGAGNDGAQGGEAIYRQTSRQGRHISIDFN